MKCAGAAMRTGMPQSVSGRAIAKLIGASEAVLCEGSPETFGM
jgi:hypothetical protein